MVRMHGHTGVHVRLLLRQLNGLPARWKVVSDNDKGAKTRRPCACEDRGPIRVEVRHVYVTVRVNQHRGAPFLVFYSMCLSLANSRHICPIAATMSRFIASLAPMDASIVSCFGYSSPAISWKTGKRRLVTGYEFLKTGSGQ